MSGGQRHTEPVDVHLILRRETADGPQVLLSRRAGQVYAAGLWHLPSGHLDGPHEDVVTALIREAREETGVVIDPADVRSAVTVHHRSPGGASRTGHFFEVRRWKGEPRIAEPDVCDAMNWAPLHALPAQAVAYCRAGLDAYTAGAHFALHFQLPGDSIAFDPGTDRLHLVPDVTGQTSTAHPNAAVVEFAERTVGRITEWTDTSWAREENRVWRVHGLQGGTWYVKVHQRDRFHQREVNALRGWVPRLGAAAPASWQPSRRCAPSSSPRSRDALCTAPSTRRRKSSSTGSAGSRPPSTPAPRPARPPARYCPWGNSSGTSTPRACSSLQGTRSS